MTVRTDKLTKNKLNQSCRTSGNLHCNYDGEIRQKWDLVITFDRGSYWRKVNASELHFAWSFQGVPTGPYLARQNLRVKYHKSWPYLPNFFVTLYFIQFQRNNIIANMKYPIGCWIMCLHWNTLQLTPIADLLVWLCFACYADSIASPVVQTNRQIHFLNLRIEYFQSMTSAHSLYQQSSQ